MVLQLGVLRSTPPCVQNLFLVSFGNNSNVLSRLGCDFQIRVDIDSLGEQILPSFYAEDRTNCMNQERRREALARGLRMVRADIEREKKGKAGVENLARALQETPKFGSEDSQSDVREKLRHMKSMLTYFEASR